MSIAEALMFFYFERHLRSVAHKAM